MEVKDWSTWGVGFLRESPQVLMVLSIAETLFLPALVQFNNLFHDIGWNAWWLITLLSLTVNFLNSSEYRGLACGDVSNWLNNSQKCVYRQSINRFYKDYNFINYKIYKWYIIIIHLILLLTSYLMMTNIYLLSAQLAFW